MILLLTWSILLAPPSLPNFMGGQAGFDAHIAQLEQHAEDDAEAALRLAQGYGSRGDVIRARRWLSVAADLGVVPSRIGLVEGDAHFTAGQYGAAVPIYLSVAEQLPRNGYAHTRLWQSVRRASRSGGSQQISRARAFLIRRGYFLTPTVAQAQPEKAARRRRLGQLHLNLGEFSKAIDLFKSALSVHGGDSESYRALGESYLATNDIDKALAAYRLFLICSPEENRFKRKARQLIRDIERRRGLVVGH